MGDRSHQLEVHVQQDSK